MGFAFSLLEKVSLFEVATSFGAHVGNDKAISKIGPLRGQSTGKCPVSFAPTFWIIVPDPATVVPTETFPTAKVLALPECSTLVAEAALVGTCEEAAGWKMRVAVVAVWRCAVDAHDAGWEDRPEGCSQGSLLECC